MTTRFLPSDLPVLLSEQGTDAVHWAASAMTSTLSVKVDENPGNENISSLSHWSV